MTANAVLDHATGRLIGFVQESGAPFGRGQFLAFDARGVVLGSAVSELAALRIVPRAEDRARRAGSASA